MNTPRTLPAEHRAKIAAAMRGRALTPAHREAIARGMAGLPKTEAHRAAIARGVRRALRARFADSRVATQPPPKNDQPVAPTFEGRSSGLVEVSNHASDRQTRSYCDRNPPATT
jgi:hypothetical protein